MTAPEITIDYLANRPGFLEQLALLSWKEWQEIYQQRDQTLEHCRKNYQERMNTDRLPITMVALTTDVSARRQESEPDSHLHAGRVRSPELLGMVSLKFHDMDTRPDLDPWLGGLLVLPKWRNRGVGTLLMHRAVEEARKLNIPRLYLWTPSAERLYAKLGWQVVERTQYFGNDAVVMAMDLSHAAE